MQRVTVPRIGADTAWRDAARRLLVAGVPPEQVNWGGSGTDRGLFDNDEPLPVDSEVTVPRSFIGMANTVVWHTDPSRFARLYGLLWRLRNAPWLMSDRGDADLAHLRGMEKAVHRCQHKMKAFVRFREIGDPSDACRSFAAWFEPTHRTVEPTAQFFRNRFADMDWRILTPDVSAIFENGALEFVTDQKRPDLPEDANEELWITYFRNIFNPARLKVQAMTSEMPRKYWKNLPEAAAIPDLIATAPARARQMVDAGPTLPPQRAVKARAQLENHPSAWSGTAEAFVADIRACTRCPLHCNATQAVLGEGPKPSTLMIVGEQPGDHEDLVGRPFVGPSGQVLDKVAGEIGLDRKLAYVTNAVKHFKFIVRGKRRIHQSPDAGEVAHCRWWLDAEIAQVKPRLIVAMGATAAQALTGSGQGLLKRRGMIERGLCGCDVLITVHPSYLLRLPDEAGKAREMFLFKADLAKAVAKVQ